MLEYFLRVGQQLTAQNLIFHRIPSQRPSPREWLGGHFAAGIHLHHCFRAESSRLPVAQREQEGARRGVCCPAMQVGVQHVHSKGEVNHAGENDFLQDTRLNLRHSCCDSIKVTLIQCANIGPSWGFGLVGVSRFDDAAELGHHVWGNIVASADGDVLACDADFNTGDKKVCYFLPCCPTGGEFKPHPPIDGLVVGVVGALNGIAHRIPWGVVPAVQGEFPDRLGHNEGDLALFVDNVIPQCAGECRKNVPCWLCCGEDCFCKHAYLLEVRVVAGACGDLAVAAQIGHKTTITSTQQGRRPCASHDGVGYAGAGHLPSGLVWGNGFLVKVTQAQRLRRIHRARLWSRGRRRGPSPPARRR